MNETLSQDELDALFSNVFVSPELCLQSFDVAANSMTFTPMTAETYRLTSFLDERIQRARSIDVTVDMKRFLESYQEAGPGPRPLGFIFHTGFCCSTLLARCLQDLDDTLVLKEPVPLRILSEHWFDLEHGNDYRNLSEMVNVILSRRFGDESVVVKATSFCNNIMHELLTAHEQTRAIFIFSSLEESIASFLKLPQRRQEARAFLGIMRNLLPENISVEDCQRLIDANVVALLWTLQVGLYCEIANSQIGGRIAALNCNQLLENPSRALAMVTGHLGIESTPDAINGAVGGTAFALHAKAPDLAFSRADRYADLQGQLENYGDEIRFACEWVRSLPLWERIPATLPAEIIVDAGVDNMI